MTIPMFNGGQGRTDEDIERGGMVLVTYTVLAVCAAGIIAAIYLITR